MLLARGFRALIVLVLVLSADIASRAESPEIAFRAAGVMPYTRVEDTVQFLIGGEYRKDCFDGAPGFCWSTFVGRRTQPETHPAQTAAREFHEETRFAFSPGDGSTPDPDRLSSSAPLPTHKSGIYVYLVEVAYVAPENIRDRQSGWTTEKLDYCWVTLPELLEAVDSPPHKLPSHCGQPDQRLFDVFRKDMTGESEIRNSIEALVAK